MFVGQGESRCFKLSDHFATGTIRRFATAHDIVCLTETHLSHAINDAEVAVPGFTLFRIDRSTSAERVDFGGVAVYVRDALVQDGTVSFLRKRNTLVGVEIAWLRVRIARGSFLFGVCYLSPETSPVYGASALDRDDIAEAVFSCIQLDLSELRLPSDEVMIAGDFNARVSPRSVRDYPDLLQLTALTELGMGALSPQTYEGVSEARGCMDTVDNIFGRNLGDMCRSVGMLICNGRVNGDMVGHFTFPTDTGGSTIDLFVATPPIVRAMQKLCVGKIVWVNDGPDCVRVSDHCPLTAVIGGHERLHEQPQSGAKRKKIAFDATQWRKYAELFTPDDSVWLRSVQAVGQQLTEGSIDSTTAVDMLGRVLSKAMAKAFGTSQANDTTACPWWTEKCQAARDVMFIERKRAEDAGRASPEWQRFVEARRHYNREKKLARANHEEQLLRDFVRTCRRDHKKLWRMLGDEARGACAIQDTGVWTRHFSALLNAGDGDFSLERVHDALGYINTRIFGNDGAWRSDWAVRQRRDAAAAILDPPITCDEVLAAIKRLPNGKSPGNESAPAECYKYARRLVQPEDEDGTQEINRLAPILHVLLQHIFDTGDFPAQFATTLVTPVHKKGDTSAPGNYRGIAVGGALAKLYASVLLQRLAHATDKLGLRHASQAGFRFGFGTAHHLFVKRVLTDRHCLAGSPPLIIVQIDFEKAFDRVPREVLWARLQERGVQGRLLTAIKRAYERVEMRVKVDGKLGAAFLSHLGVKQGDPLSTELFGLYIEALGDLIDAHDQADGPESSRFPNHAPKLGGKPVSLLFYADDISLLATSAARMKELLRYVDDFCSWFGMRANVKKCERLIFAESAEDLDRLASQCSTLRLRGEPIPAVTRARYLGLVYGPGGAFSTCREALNDAARGAMFSVLSRTHKRKIMAPDVRMRLFDAQVRAIATYGCEAWGPDMLLDAFRGGPPGNRVRTSNNLAGGLFEATLKDPAVKLQITYMRRCVGAARPAHRLLFAELGQLPMHYFVFKMLIGFYNRIQKQPRTLCHAALRDELIEAIAARDNGLTGSNLARLDSWGRVFLWMVESLADVWHDAPSGHSRHTAMVKADWFYHGSCPRPRCSVPSEHV
jgi:exonuclease III